MTRPNGHSDNGNAGAIQEPAGNETFNDVVLPAAASIPLPEVATRAKQRAKQQIQQNRFVIIGAGAIVVALLIFVATSMPHRGAPEKVKSRATAAADDLALENGNASNDKSLFPVTDSGRPVTKESHEGFINERDLQRTATKSAARASGARWELWDRYHLSENSRHGKHHPIKQVRVPAVPRLQTWVKQNARPWRRLR